VTRRRPLTALVLSLGLATGLGACGGDDEGDQTKVTTQTTASGEKKDGPAVTLKAPLSGAEEVPGPGADPGVGAALVEISGTKVCPDLKVTMGEKPTKAHIHQGAKGVSGPVVVDLQPEFTPGESAFTSKKCVDAPAEITTALVANPSAYYLNVHSDAHPDGAVRGQLDKF
jgi:CHRD domain